jgi:hypothetical protein
LLGFLALTITRATDDRTWWRLLAGTVVAVGAAGFGLPGVALHVCLLD